MKITILTAVFNAERTVEQTISSVVCQDYPNIEYIIVDGSSTDSTVDIIKEYEHYGIRWISEPDGGIYDALNKGVRMATGAYIEIIGADDALAEPDIISRIASQLDEDTDVLCGQVWSVDEGTKRQGIYSNTNMRDRKRYRGGMTPHAAVFARRELLLRYPFDEKYRISADYKFFLQCYFDESVRIRYCDEIVAFFSAAGVSSDELTCWAEDNCVHKELGISFCAPNYTSSSLLKRTIKQFFIVLHLFLPMKKIWVYLNRHFRWEKHTCNNKICRWCGRKEKD